MTYATAAPATAGGNANSPVSPLADVVVMTVRSPSVSKNAGHLLSIAIDKPELRVSIRTQPSTDPITARMPELHNEHHPALAPR